MDVPTVLATSARRTWVRRSPSSVPCADMRVLLLACPGRTPAAGLTLPHRVPAPLRFKSCPGAPTNQSTMRVLAPAAGLMARLTYARKFALIGLILVVPSLIALHAYWAQQSGQIAFSAKERVGVRELGPANTLLARLV